MTSENDNLLAVNGKISEFILKVLNELTDIDVALKRKGLDEALHDRLVQCKAKLDIAVELAHVSIVNQSLQELRLNKTK